MPFSGPARANPLPFALQKLGRHEQRGPGAFAQNSAAAGFVYRNETGDSGTVLHRHVMRIQVRHCYARALAPPDNWTAQKHPKQLREIPFPAPTLDTAQTHRV